jgi:hypothetical protein
MLSEAGEGAEFLFSFLHDFLGCSFLFKALPENSIQRSVTRTHSLLFFLLRIIAPLLLSLSFFWKCSLFLVMMFLVVGSGGISVNVSKGGSLLGQEQESLVRSSFHGALISALLETDPLVSIFKGPYLRIQHNRN